MTSDEGIPLTEAWAIKVWAFDHNISEDMAETAWHSARYSPIFKDFTGESS